MLRSLDFNAAYTIFSLYNDVIHVPAVVASSPLALTSARDSLARVLASASTAAAR